MKRGLLIVLSGPSGVGKGTVRKVLMNNDSLNLYYSVSMTTRKPRVGETEGVDYFFVSKEKFMSAIKNHELLEHAKFVNNYYGTPKFYVEKLRDEGKNVLIEIETRGAKQVMSSYAEDDRFVTIFLMPPSFEELEKWIRGRRTETDEVVKERLNKARREIALNKLYDFVVVNDSPENAANEIANILKNKSLD